MRMQGIGIRLAVMGLLAATLFNVGCVTNGRRILLKEYGATIPVQEDQRLDGVTVCIKGFTSVPDLIAMELTDEPAEPEGFKYSELTKEHDKLWSAEAKALVKQKTEKEDWWKIGNMRNMFGMVLSHVYALNDPAEWLEGSLKYDLEAQGAKVVDASQASEADVSISGTIQLCRADMYITVNASLVVDLIVEPKQGEAHESQIHTFGATAAMLASDGEFFHAYRDARQKFAIFTIREIKKSVK